MADLTDAIQVLDDSAPYGVRSISSADKLIINAELDVNADVVIDANLTVTGTMTAVETENVLVEDNHLYLNSGYTTAVAQTGGLVINYLPTATSDSVNGSFTAGVPATSNPTVVTSGSGTFSVGDLIQISGAADPGNNGLFEVLSHTGTTLTIRGVGTTATVEDFTQNQFVADSTAQGTITKVNVSVLRAGTDGAWEQGSGSTTGISFTDLGSGSGNSLQQAYVQGNQITTSAGEGDVIFAGTEKVQVTATGGLDVDTQFDFDGTVFDVAMSGANGFSIDGGAASNVSVDSGNLTLSTTTSGDVDISSVGDVDVDGVNVQLDATSAVSIDAAAASNFTVDGANLTLSTTTSGNVIVNSVADVDVDGVNVTVDASSGFSVDGAAASNVSTTSADLTISTITSGELDLTSAGLMDVNAGANLDIDVTGTFDMLSTGAFSIDGTGASNVTADTGNLTLSTTTSGNVIVNSVADVDVDGVNVNVDASSAFSVDGAAASNVSVTGANLTLSTITSGQLILTSADDMDVNVPTASTTAMTVSDGSNTYLEVDSTAATPTLDLPQFNNITGDGVGVIITTDDALVQGDLVHIKATTGNVGLADANTGNLIDGLIAGISLGTFSGSNPAKLVSAPGSLVPVRFTAAPAAADNGKPVWLSSTAGQATMTMPTGASVVKFMIGYLQGGNGADTTPNVLYQPQFISRGASVT